jgi:hypothetical protein
VGILRVGRRRIEWFGGVGRGKGRGRKKVGWFLGVRKGRGWKRKKKKILLL